jgi:hypothetical protein
VLEWYDFAIYGYFASAIGRQFFPHENPVAQLLSAFGVFALGYLMRPLGGACRDFRSAANTRVRWCFWSSTRRRVAAA